jgi:hypothetical protein
MKNRKYHTVETVLKYHTVETVLKYHTVETVIKYHTVETVLKYHTVETVLKYHTVETVPNTKNDIERSNTDIPNAQIYDCVLSWYRTDISIKGSRKLKRNSNTNEKLARTAFCTLLE